MPPQHRSSSKRHTPSLPICALIVGALACADASTPAPPSSQADVGEVPAFTPSPFQPAPDEEAAVLAALQAAFDALETADEELLRATLHPDVRMHSVDMRTDPPTPSISTLEGLAERITSSPEPLIERMFDAEVRVSGDLAMVWTPYDFYVGSEFSHCGVDTATLMRTEGGWQIVGLYWTRDEPPGCALHPDGPPERGGAAVP